MKKKKQTKEEKPLLIKIRGIEISKKTLIISLVFLLISVSYSVGKFHGFVQTSAVFINDNCENYTRLDNLFYEDNQCYLGKGEYIYEFNNLKIRSNYTSGAIDKIINIIILGKPLKNIK